MRINLLHNKIVRDTVSDKFIESFNANLVPKLKERFPNADKAVLYEDYLSDGFLSSGAFYCPITIIEDEISSYVFVSWQVNAKKFENSVPYSYTGQDLMEFNVCDTVPNGFRERLSDRVHINESAHITLRIEGNFGSKTFLSGKYSQSFADLMAQKITSLIEKEFSIDGTEDSTLELSLVFSPFTFMEHVADRVTYRRIQISARACSPRDLWIRWIPKVGNAGYTVASHVSDEDIIFEIPEDVPEKIREKEYRYLVNQGSVSAYKNAMSRKNFTEWRELLKRVIKRGEVEELQYGNNIATDEDSIAQEPKADKFEVPSFAGVGLKLEGVFPSYSDEEETKSDPEEEINPDIKELLRSLLQNNKEDDKKDDELPPLDDEISDNVSIEAANFPEEDIFAESDTAIEAAEQDSESELLSFVAAQQKDPEEENVFLNDELISENRELLLKIEALETERQELIRKLAESEDAKRELEKAVFAAEEERRETALKLEKQEFQSIVQQKEIDNLRESIKAVHRSEERERDRIAEAARVAVEEQKKQNMDVDIEEERRLAEELLKRRKEEAEQQEAERLSKEREEAERARAAALAIAESEPESAEPQFTAPQNQAVKYVSKKADIIFRSPVDPNITKRIQEIVVTTVKYFNKENVYMKIKASIPEHNLVRLEFLKIPENESALLTDIIRVLGHSKLGITKVLLD